ncbi:TetR/AcrR family transcriptional regulator [Bifidobacterium choloepi]|uniref:TetR/AcrR family transcriptional regulator n=1 Tax=Bifidobacterium choloepi TaxID=2614131 RepID=A0A6I5MZV6_9BIFI|nr:TetR/AcrR family transcriptional regulator [Bifidobacterium choloepi]NEG69797.1 TetR/AcrR family transcriptional regulator [Bifidobacterium choloepi]
MPRPRRDSEILPAKDRLENAFWELLADREFHRITVTDVVREADVNRNSFYYHFSGLPELADSAILHEVQNIPTPAPPQPDLDPDEEWMRYCSALLADPDQRQRLDRLALLAGPHSSPDLQESLHDFVRMTLMSILDLDSAHVDVKTSLLINFTIGGLLSVLQQWPTLEESLSVEDLMSEDIAVLAMGIYLSMSKESMMAYWRRIFESDRPMHHKFALQHSTVS